MKKYAIVTIHNGCLHYMLPSGSIITCHRLADLFRSPKPLTFKTLEGARARIRRDVADGEPGELAPLELPESFGSALGALAAGKPKTISKAESKARAARLAKARASRWATA